MHYFINWIVSDGNTVSTFPGCPDDSATDCKLHTGLARTGTAQALSGTTITAVPALDLNLKYAANYIFEYNLIYSIGGLAVGAQFGVELVGLSADSIGYSVMMAADGSNMRSAATTTEGGMIGSGSSFGGGGPWSATITGALRTPESGVSIGRLLMRGQGIGVTLTLQPNSTAWFQEM
jgi:hypothetical protein